MTPTTILLALAMFAYALTWAPGKFKPAWSRQLKPWQALVGLVALIVALFIIMNPEFYALGLLGDSAFFDLLVLAISLQLQSVVFRACGLVMAGVSKTRRYFALLLYVTCSLLALACADIVSVIQKIAHRISS